MKKSLPKFQVDKYRLMKLSWNTRETFVIHVLSTRIKQVRMLNDEIRLLDKQKGLSLFQRQPLNR